MCFEYGGVEGVDVLRANQLLAHQTLYLAQAEANVAYATANGHFGDIDGNGQADALTDGLMLLRYLFNLRGNALISGAVAGDATRTTATDIEAYIVSLMP
jgi:hypothetical protein